ncbi:MAG: sulfotransferase domain-containing protein [Chloroflexota bacterium]|nr:sulfotransferase domain-containing protein [Chloroflexota bacterium]
MDLKRIFSGLLGKGRKERTGHRNDVIVVSGLPRSGTSMMMRMLEAGGVPTLTDGVREANADNPDGYYEFERVKALEHDKEWVQEARGRAVKVISALLEHLPRGHTYKVVFMERHLDEVLASQRRMLQREGKPTDEVNDESLRELFEKHLAESKDWLRKQPHVEALYICYNEAIADPSKAAASVNRFLGGNLDEEAMSNVIDPTLYRQRK